MKLNYNNDSYLDPGEISIDIEDKFKKFNLGISIKDWRILDDRILFRARPKGNTKFEQLQACAKDVQAKLRLKTFNMSLVNFDIYIVVSDREVEYVHLPEALKGKRIKKLCNNMKLPYIVGYDPMMKLEMMDLADQPMLLMGGATNSGKSVGLRAMLTSILYYKSPKEVNIVLIDVGCEDLLDFEGTPHLACPVVTDRHKVPEVMAALKDEMERRIRMKKENSAEYDFLPRIVLVVDEFPALFSSYDDKDTSKRLAETFSELLRRGRHAKIHLVLAAQNPTYQNMKIDLGNITARIAFQCARKNNSETILGERGAEYLRGKGDMLLKDSQHVMPLRLQGVFISSEELNLIMYEIKARSATSGFADYYKFSIPDDYLSEQNKSSNWEERLLNVRVEGKLTSEERLFCEILVWAFDEKVISINKLKHAFKIGWDRAKMFVTKLEKYGIVEKAGTTKSRIVMPDDPRDLPEELLDLLDKNGYDNNYLYALFYGDD